MEKLFVENWWLNIDDKKIPASVPGDITIDLYRAGMISNPYYGMNYVENSWIARKDFTYETDIEITDEILSQESIVLTFEGVDVFADVYLNGKLLGSTENMFLQYRFEIKDFLRKGVNRLCVCMKATLNKMDEFDTTGYAAVFNVKRLFVRKAQCHFGWDWAPKICAYGIWQNVYMEYGSNCKIDDVQAVADSEGNLTLFTELNYNIHATYDVDGNDVTDSSILDKQDTLHYYLSKEPFGDDYEKLSFKVSGKKDLLFLSITARRIESSTLDLQ